MSGFGIASLGVVAPRDPAPQPSDDPPPTSAAPDPTPEEPIPMAKPKKTPAEKILDAIAAAGGELAGAELRDQLDLEDNERKAAITSLKRAGKIESEGSTVAIVYRLTGSTPKAKTPKAAPTRKNAAAATARHSGKTLDAIEQAEAAESTLKALQFSASVAQDALEAYVRSIGNPAILDPLLAARDRSRQALEAFVAQGH